MEQKDMVPVSRSDRQRRALAVLVTASENEQFEIIVVYARNEIAGMYLHGPLGPVRVDERSARRPAAEKIDPLLDIQFEHRFDLARLQAEPAGTAGEGKEENILE